MKRKNSRRTYLSLLLTGLLVVSTVTLGGAALSFAKSSPTVTDGNWTANRADAGRTGATTGTGPGGPYAGTDWTVNPDGRPSGAVVEGDTVYLGVETFAEYNRRNGKVVAYDAQTGAVRWNRTDLGGVDESPTIANGTVYVTTDNRSAGVGSVHAIDDSGDERWGFETTAELTSPPSVAGETVYVGGVYASVESATHESEYIDHPSELIGTMYAGPTAYAINASDGIERWSYVTELAERHDSRLVVPANGTLYLVEDDFEETTPSGTVHALSASDQRPDEGHRVADDLVNDPNDGENTTTTETTTMTTTTRTTTTASTSADTTTTRTTTDKATTTTANDDGQPRFGILVAFVALVAAALLIDRRER